MPQPKCESSSESECPEPALAGDDTLARVARLCAKTKAPVRADLVQALGLDFRPTVGAVCVYPITGGQP